MSKTKIDLENSISEKIVDVHMYIVITACLILGVFNIFTNWVAAGIGIIAAGIVTFVVVRLLTGKLSKIMRGAIITAVQLLLILAISMMKGELGNFFALLVCSMALSAVYYDNRILIGQWIAIDLVTVIAVFFKDVFYAHNSTTMVMQGIVSLNIAGVILYYLLRCTAIFINDANGAKNRSDELLVQVNSQMDDSKRLMDEQTAVVEKVQVIAQSLDSTAGLMEQISTTLSAGAQEQESTISEISKDIMGVVSEAQQSLSEASAALEAAQKSTSSLKENNSEVRAMVVAMQEINDASKQIESIIRTIEDIAFQTNILALNAAVEAARAGSSGKGFAVVADEVRNLASKSADAAKTTSALIETAIASVDKGTDYARRVAERMDEVIDISERSKEHSRQIAAFTRSQVDSINAVKVKIENISYVVSQTSQTSEESAEIARSVNDEVRKMNAIIR